MVWQGCVVIYFEELCWKGADLSEVVIVVAAFKFSKPRVWPWGS